jgi:hypothetical protein
MTLRLLRCRRRHRRLDEQLQSVQCGREQRRLWIELDTTLAVVIGGISLTGGPHAVSLIGLRCTGTNARTYVPDDDHDLVLCVGSTHAFGGFAATLERAAGT